MAKRALEPCGVSELFSGRVPCSGYPVPLPEPERPGIPLARLSTDQIAALDTLLSETLGKPDIEDFVHTNLKKQRED